MLMLHRAAGRPLLSGRSHCLLLPPQRSQCAPPAHRQQVVRSAAAAPQASATERVVGIDLGTTNSAIAVVEEGVPRIIPTADGRTTPSVVTYAPEGQVFVGRAAKRAAPKEPGNTFYSTKRLIGRPLSSVKHDAQKLAYQVTGDEKGGVILQCNNAPSGLLRPEDVAAELLRHLLAAAEADLGGRITHAVISVPAYFDPAQRAATVAAGKLAGLDTVRIIREPVAAALAYGLDLSEEATVLVADLGGGTFDVAILEGVVLLFLQVWGPEIEVGGGTVEVLATGGDAALGGDDWDAAIAKYLVDKHLKPAGFKIRSPATRARLKGMSEKAKVALSQRQEVLLTIPLGGGGGGGDERPPLEVVLTQSQLDSLAAPLFRKALVPLEDACAQAGVDLKAALEAAEKDRGYSDGRRVSRRKQAKSQLQVQLQPKQRDPISEVLLVGGATRMPSFRRFITNATGQHPRESAVDPDEAVAVGAAIQAAMLQGDLDGLMVMDVWQAALMRAFAGDPAVAADLTELEDVSEEDMERMLADLEASE